jgi:predicted esterase
MRLVALLASPALAQTMPNAGRLAQGLIFNQPSPFATNQVLAERLLSPRQRDRQLMSLEADGKTLAPFSLDLTAERFLVYIPKEEHQAGYGLLVFIPPWENARLPLGWARVLDREGLIFVTADRSGNDESIMGRRIPLALTATYALTQRYRIDSTRIFVSGFSGGSRVALRAAIAFPDIFSGVVLQSGSDPIGPPYIPLPSQSLMSLLQTQTRFVFVSGENDEINVSKDAESRMSLSAWCIRKTRTLVRLHLGHEIMDGNSLAEALDALNRSYPEAPVASIRCQTSMAAKLQRARDAAAALRTQADSPKVREQLDSLDREFGGLLDENMPLTPAQSK